MDPVISGGFQNITMYQENLTTFKTNFKLDAASAWGVLEGITKNVYATLAIGGTVISSLISLPTYLWSFVTAIQSVMPGMIPDAFIWILMTVAGIWVGSMILKSLRGTEQT
jgi:hypothetical protein